MAGRASSKRALVVAGVVLALVVVGVGGLRIRAWYAPLGQCPTASGGGDRQGTASLLSEAGEFRTIETWSADGGPANPPVDNTVRATATIGAWGNGATDAQPAAAHVATSDDVDVALGRGYRVATTLEDVDGGGSFGTYRNYVKVAVGIAPDGSVAFLGECAEMDSRWFAGVARELGMTPEAVLVDFLDHRGWSALDTRYLDDSG